MSTLPSKTLRDYYTRTVREKKSFNYIKEFCNPVLKSYAVKRLESITFLGILSPKFKTFVSPSKLHYSHILDDGSRKDHSIGVALLMLKVGQKLNLKDETLKYAVCWGLLHDIATWPLSHTGEAAFSNIFNISGKKLREMMIIGSSRLPKKYSVKNELESIGIDPKILLLLFEKENKLKDIELQKVWQIIHSPVTPDTLEGMWRSGKIFNVKIPSPFHLGNKFKSDLFDTYILKKDSLDFINFWRQKSLLYKKYINNENTVLLESIWSNSIIKYFRDLSLQESLEIPETRIISIVSKSGLIKDNKTNRYKTPQLYYTKKNIKKLNDISVIKLHDFFLKKRKYEPF